MRIAILTGLVLAWSVSGWARGIVDQPAPDWGVDEWVFLPNGQSAPEVSDFQGKVVYVYAFQSWCPGCHKHGFPTLQKMMKQYADDPDVVFVAIQTTFEGFGSNGPAQALQTAKRYNLDIPVGQSGLPNSSSKFMQRYDSGGTPWTVIIGPDGKVKYNDFHISPAEAMELIDDLKAS
ncbi:MAG: TlpA disulfide reductase family protein [Verrucomicrobiota bacterium]